jgi:hypothetical protein
MEAFFNKNSKILLILLTIFSISFIGSCVNDQFKKENLRIALLEKQRITPDANGFTYYDEMKLEIGAKINYHKCNLIETGGGEAVYSYREGEPDTCGKYYEITIRNGKIYKISRRGY